MTMKKSLFAALVAVCAVALTAENFEGVLRLVPVAAAAVVQRRWLG